MKTKRNLSGIYIRALCDDKWDSVCFEDLTPPQQDRWLKDLDPEGLRRLSKLLANTLNEIGDQLDIVKK